MSRLCKYSCPPYRSLLHTSWFSLPLRLPLITITPFQTRCYSHSNTKVVSPLSPHCLLMYQLESRLPLMQNDINWCKHVADGRFASHWFGFMQAKSTLDTFAAPKSAPKCWHGSVRWGSCSLLDVHGQAEAIQGRKCRREGQITHFAKICKSNLLVSS